jgi:hypothetical protein
MKGSTRRTLRLLVATGLSLAAFAATALAALAETTWG